MHDDCKKCQPLPKHKKQRVLVIAPVPQNYLRGTKTSWSIGYWHRYSTIGPTQKFTHIQYTWSNVGAPSDIKEYVFNFSLKIVNKIYKKHSCDILINVKLSVDKHFAEIFQTKSLFSLNNQTKWLYYYFNYLKLKLLTF